VIQKGTLFTNFSSWQHRLSSTLLSNSPRWQAAQNKHHHHTNTGYHPHCSVTAQDGRQHRTNITTSTPHISLTAQHMIDIPFQTAISSSEVNSTNKIRSTTYSV
jgi:hypothetical protein